MNRLNRLQTISSELASLKRPSDKEWAEFLKKLDYQKPRKTPRSHLYFLLEDINHPWHRFQSRIAMMDESYARRVLSSWYGIKGAAMRQFKALPLDHPRRRLAELTKDSHPMTTVVVIMQMADQEVDDYLNNV